MYSLYSTLPLGGRPHMRIVIAIQVMILISLRMGYDIAWL